MKKTAYFFQLMSHRIEALASSPELLGQRIDALYQLTTDQPKILITHGQALVRYLPSRQLFLDNCLNLKTGMQIDIYDLQKLLIRGWLYISTASRSAVLFF